MKKFVAKRNRKRKTITLYRVRAWVRDPTGDEDFPDVWFATLKEAREKYEEFRDDAYLTYEKGYLSREVILDGGTRKGAARLLNQTGFMTGVGAALGSFQHDVLRLRNCENCYSPIRGVEKNSSSEVTVCIPCKQKYGEESL